MLTISGPQAAVPSTPMQNLWPILIRAGSSTVVVLKGICYMLENRFFSTYFEEAIEESASTSSLSISAEMPIK